MNARPPRRLKLITKAALLRLAIVAAVFAAASAWMVTTMLSMPGKSHTGPLPPLTEEEEELREHLRLHVEHLARDIGPRNFAMFLNYSSAADYIAAQFASYGYKVEEQRFTVDGHPCRNIIAAHPGSDEIIVVGAHYDTVGASPGANDNASGVAALLELARRWRTVRCERTVRFVAFANEEPPHFQTDDMGSRVYARSCRERGDPIVAMLSLETIGYYSDTPGSQHYPLPLGLWYPSTGDFIAFVGNRRSRALVHTVIESFRRHTRFPSEGAALPEPIPGVGWSDHWSFWQEGYPALMVTDTAPFRYPHYHSPEDTPDKLDFDRYARVVAGLARVLEELAAAK